MRVSHLVGPAEAVAERVGVRGIQGLSMDSDRQRCTSQPISNEGGGSSSVM